jgi:hypothetical protein
VRSCDFRPPPDSGYYAGGRPQPPHLHLSDCGTSQKLVAARNLRRRGPDALPRRAVRQTAQDLVEVVGNPPTPIERSRCVRRSPSTRTT